MRPIDFCKLYPTKAEDYIKANINGDLSDILNDARSRYRLFILPNFIDFLPELITQHKLDKILAKNHSSIVSSYIIAYYHVYFKSNTPLAHNNFSIQKVREIEKYDPITETNGAYSVNCQLCIDYLSKCGRISDLQYCYNRVFCMYSNFWRNYYFSSLIKAYVYYDVDNVINALADIINDNFTFSMLKKSFNDVFVCYNIETKEECIRLVNLYRITIYMGLNCNMLPNNKFSIPNSTYSLTEQLIHLNMTPEEIVDMCEKNQNSHETLIKQIPDLLDKYGVAKYKTFSPIVDYRSIFAHINELTNKRYNRYDDQVYKDNRSENTKLICIEIIKNNSPDIFRHFPVNNTQYTIDDPICDLYAYITIILKQYSLCKDVINAILEVNPDYFKKEFNEKCGMHFMVNISVGISNTPEFIDHIKHLIHIGADITRRNYEDYTPLVVVMKDSISRVINTNSNKLIMLLISTDTVFDHNVLYLLPSYINQNKYKKIPHIDELMTHILTKFALAYTRKHCSIS